MMEDRLKAILYNVKNILFLLPCVMVLLLSGFLTGCDSDLVNKDVVNEPVDQNNDEQNGNKSGNDLSAIERMISDFLRQDEVFSTSDVVGSGYPAFYYFSEQGTYAYLGNQYGVREEGQLLSQRGEWTVQGNILVLFVKEEKRAYGGEPTDDLLLGQVLTDFQVVHEQESYELAYAVSFGEDEDNGLPHLLWNREPLYMLAIPEVDIVPLRILADEGYPAFEKIFN
jgi:hypothetical protein